MLYSALVVVCMAATPVQQCNGPTSLHYMAAPEPQQGLSACAIHGLQYAAESHLVVAGTYAKVFCRPVVRERGVI